MLRWIAALIAHDELPTLSEREVAARLHPHTGVVTPHGYKR
jgi:hypothetical protein